MKQIIFETINTLGNFFCSPHHPSIARLYITSRCNLKCMFCEMGSPQTKISKKYDLNAAEWINIIEKLKKWGVSRLYVTGGEPFLCQDIWEILAYCDRINMRISAITTNGMLLPGLKQDQIDILNKIVDCLSISLDSADKKTHDRFRGVDSSFDKIISFLESPPPKLLPRIHLVTVVSRYSLNQILPLARLALKYRVRFTGFQPINFMSNFPEFEAIHAKNEMIPGSEDLISLESELKEAQKLLDKSGISNNLQLLRYWISPYFINALKNNYFFLDLVKKFHCFSMYQQILIDWHGNVLPCSLLPPVGNIRSIPISHVWNQGLNPIRARLKLQNYFSECKSCFCEFPLNLRYSIIASPVKNRKLLVKFIDYYRKRIPTRY